MTRLSVDQLAMYAAAAGASNPQVAAAVAMAESGGETTAHNPIPPDDSYGPWQINMRGALGPDRRAKLGITSNSQLYDPATNARAMVMISGGGSNFAAWSTYSSGAYERYLPAGTAVPTMATPAIDWNDPFGLVPKKYKDKEPGSPGGDLLNNLGAGADTVSGAVHYLAKAAGWLSVAANWVRVGYVVGGGVIVVVGLAMVVKDQELSAASGQVGKLLGGSAKKIAKKGTA